MDGVSAVSLRVEQNGRGPVVYVAGDLDIATAPQLRGCLRSLRGSSVTLDFSAVTFMDSTALGVLIGARQRLQQVGGSLVLRGVQPPQMKVLEVTGLAQAMTGQIEAPENRSSPTAPA